MENTLSIVKESKETKRKPVITWREHDVTEDCLFYATDEVGRSGWFLRLSVTGMYTRRVGPFPSRKKALDELEEFLAVVEPEAFCELANQMSVKSLTFVIEGIPTLTAQKGSVSDDLQTIP